MKTLKIIITVIFSTITLYGLNIMVTDYNICKSTHTNLEALTVSISCTLVGMAIGYTFCEVCYNTLFKKK